MDLGGDSTANKLMLLFVFDKMEVPITDKTILEMCTSRNVWITYMDCVQALNQLLDVGFIYQTTHDKNNYYSITPDGRMCLASFYMRIPSSLRTEITEYIKENRMIFKRKQEYFKNYSKNADGTYTVLLKIIDPVQTTLEIKMNVANRQTAKTAFNKWDEKAAQVYSALYDQLID